MTNVSGEENEWKKQLNSFDQFIFLNVKGFIIQKKKDSDTNLQRKMRGKSNRAANQLDQAARDQIFLYRSCSSFNL